MIEVSKVPIAEAGRDAPTLKIDRKNRMYLGGAE
jgi:hypothetical protein